MKLATTIRIGYELSTGAAVDIPLGHLAVTGQTQQSGKTTTLEALVYRSGRRAIAFRTKRAESCFGSHAVRSNLPPYFAERADWQFVQAILEATLREKLRFERGWIMRVSKGAQTLRDVRDNITEALKTAKGLNADIYWRLAEYLDIVLPQIDRLPATDELRIGDGINVMDVSDYSSEMQALVIRSVLQWVHDNENNVIVVIPEAWEFIPEGRGGPVKLAAEHLIRKGAAAGNYVWLDSQDLAGVDAVARKAISVWVMGVQRADLEVKRVLAHLPKGAATPKAAEIMQLGLGEFFVSYGRELKKVYVQPAWMEPVQATQVAVGHINPRFLAAKLAPQGYVDQRLCEQQTSLKTVAVGKEDPVWEERYREEKERADGLQRRLETVEAELKRLKVAPAPANDSPRSVQEMVPNARVYGSEPETALPVSSGDATTDHVDQLYSAVRARLLQDPVLMKLVQERNEIEVTVRRNVIAMDSGTLRGAIAGLVARHFFAEQRGASEVKRELERRGSGSALPNVCKELDRITEMGFLYVEGAKGGRKYIEVPDMKVNIVEAA